MTINASIAGGGGFVAGELLRLLAQHPQARVASVTSVSHAGAPVAGVHAGTEDLDGLRFAERINPASDVLFLCLPHGESERFLQDHAVGADTVLIDLSQDHRHLSAADGWLYGLPETARDELRGARARGMHVANPGCFATAIQLGLLPLFSAGRVHGDVHTSAITGSTGAGGAQLPTLHYSWRSGNVQVYKTFTHQHLREIRATFTHLMPGFAARHFFVPYRGPFTRGIIATSYTPFDGTAGDARALCDAFYAGHPFVRRSEAGPDLKQVVNTNNAMLSVDVIEGMCVTVTVIDNLLKGAAGQAVQNMNLCFGLDERSGLRLKASAF